jgi:leukotriene-A4 hydrolase
MMKYMRFSVVAVVLLMMASCKLQEHPISKEEGQATPINDPHSFARPEIAKVKHLDLDIAVDFDKQQIAGTATWTIENNSKGSEIIFDVDHMNILHVMLDADSTEATWSVDSAKPILGKALHVSIKATTRKVRLQYSTSANASALQWLQPQQTGGKKFPFLYTQSQSIHARSWIPCQDGPAVRFTYNANVKVPAQLMAVMSAENPQEKAKDGTYYFKQTHPVPSYLMALAVGDFKFKPIDKRTGIYAEPLMLDKAVWEFADMGKMVDAAEKIYGPYKWGRYDLLVLPPSFPYGGMENPNLTFATPTVIAGDRSLVSLVAHELAHSWSGNLVTNATWNDMWLNEGFTNYFERRLLEALYGTKEMEMQELLGKQDWLRDAKELGDTSRDASLRSDYTGRDPDLIGSNVVYEKGYSFLKMLELHFGREKFDAFLKDYFSSYAFQSMTTKKILGILKEKLFQNDEAQMKKLRIDEWIYQPGEPANAPVYTASAFTALDSVLLAWKTSNYQSAAVFTTQKLSTNESLYLITHLPAGITAQQMQIPDSVYHFTTSGNAEIQSAWYTLAVKKAYQPAVAATDAFLISVGRMKFTKPIYKAMVETVEGKARALKVFESAKQNYHPIAVKTIEGILFPE